MIDNLRWQWLRRHMWRDELWQRIAWALPRELVKWATVRCFAHATMPPWGDTHPDSLNYSDVMKRWEQDRG